MTTITQCCKLALLICLWILSTPDLYSQDNPSPNHVNVNVRDGDDKPDCSSRIGVRLNDKKKRRTGWFGRPEKIKLDDQDTITLTSTNKNSQQFIIRDKYQAIESLTFYLTKKADNYYPVNIVSGTLFFEISKEPIHKAKLCAYDQFGNLVDSTYSLWNGEFAVGFADTVENPQILAFFSTTTCPNPLVEETNNLSPPDLDITVIENPDDNVRIGVGIDDNKMDHILEGLGGNRTDLPTDRYFESRIAPQR